MKHKYLTGFTLCVWSATGIWAAPGKKKAPNPTAPAITAAELNATQGEAPKPPAAESLGGKFYLEAFGGYGLTYPGILSNPTSGNAAFNGDPRAGLLFAWNWSASSGLVASGYYNSKSTGLTGGGTLTYKTAFIAGSLGFRFYSNAHFYGELGGYYGNPLGDWKIETSVGNFSVNSSDRKADIGLYIAGGYLFHLGEKLRLNLGINLQIGVTQVQGNLTANNASVILGLGYLF